jgi:hypothetical protein
VGELLVNERNSEYRNFGLLVFDRRLVARAGYLHVISRLPTGLTDVVASTLTDSSWVAQSFLPLSLEPGLPFVEGLP